MNLNNIDQIQARDQIAPANSLFLDKVWKGVRGKSNLPDVSIIIVNWNTRDLLLRCLKTVFNTIRTLDFEVIVVDNASIDGSVSAVHQYFPRAHLLLNCGNAGYAKANNQALVVARGRYYLLLNSDAFVHEGAIETLVRYMDDFPDVGAAGPRLYYGDGRLQRSCFSFPSLSTQLWQTFGLDRLFPKHPVFGKYRMTYWNFDEFRDVDSMIGACMILRREAIDQVGNLDESFFMYSEEVDLCFRLKNAGWRIRFVPSASATHVWGGASQKVQEETFLRLYKSKVLFFRKHYGKSSAFLYKLILFLESISRIILGPLGYFIRKDRQNIRSTRPYWFLIQALRAF